MPAASVNRVRFMIISYESSVFPRHVISGGCPTLTDSSCAKWRPCIFLIPVGFFLNTWSNADDRLALDSLGRVERGDGVVEGRDVANVRPQSSVPDPLDELTQLGAIGYDDEVDSQAARGPRLGRAGNGQGPRITDRLNYCAE